jgi:hypothetical protein
VIDTMDEDVFIEDVKVRPIVDADRIV